MITFEMKKTKSLSMPILVEGIDQGMLRFKFVVDVNGVDYGFPAMQEGDTVKFVIPALEKVVKNLKEGTYNAKLEVSSITEGDRGFFMMPWAEQVRVKQSVSVEVEDMKDEAPVAEENDKKVNIKFTSIFAEQDGEVEEEPVHEEEPKVKNDRLRDFMG